MVGKLDRRGMDAQPGAKGVFKMFLSVRFWLRSWWTRYMALRRGSRLHINAGIIFAVYLLFRGVFEAASHSLLLLAFCAWLVAIYTDLAGLYRRIYETLIGKALLAVAFVAATVLAHAISGLVVNGVTGVDPSKFPYAETLVSLMAIPFLVFLAAVPAFILLILFGPFVVLHLGQGLGALRFLAGQDIKVESSVKQTSGWIHLFSWVIFVAFTFQMGRLVTARYEVLVSNFARDFIFNFEMYGHSRCVGAKGERVAFIGGSEVLVARRQGDGVVFDVRQCN